MSNKPQTILFRADSSSTIGTGHIMRDLVLAEQFPEAKIIFAVQDLSGNINHKIKEKHYPVQLLSSNDIEELLALIEKHQAEMLVIDHYGIDIVFEKALKERYPSMVLMVLDDTYEAHHCDILLNHNVYAKAEDYKDLVPEECELRCGEKYTLLREEFLIEKQKGRQNRNDPAKLDVLVAMGGADHSNLNIKILKTLENFPAVHPHVVTTTANRFLPELRSYAADKKNITLHINTDHVARLMNKADFAIVTPSVTVNEIVYMNTPFIAIKTADNQRYMYEYLEKNNYPVLKTFDTYDLKNSIQRMIDHISIELVNFTDLTLDEKKMGLKWRNHPNISKWMFTQKPISLNAHLDYIESLKSRKDRVYFLVKKASRAIGVIDFTNIDHDNKRAELGIYSNPQIKGVGSILMTSILDYAFGVLKIETLASEVFKENSAAIKLYRRYNFKDTGTKEMGNRQILQMELDIENR
jgi:UDP-2,4-diacetamido-2,4,6-trideoxy-beta-L-altropyranose hydrolase/UDP-4-amino-4,6-dideoxy-N-acetyl-beta-L-altrosamine N-acetyltransferase